MNNVLVIQTAFIGDVILSTPLASELKRIYPKVNVDFLVKKGNESLLQNNPFIKDVYTLDKSQGKYRAIYSLVKEFRSKHYDLVINLHRFGSSGLIAVFSGGKKVYGFKKNPFAIFYTKSFEHKIGDGTHEVERNLSLIAEFGASKIVKPQLFPTENDFQKVAEYAKQGQYFCFAPSSVWFTKQLPLEKWLELLHIKEKQGKVYLLGAPSDTDLCDAILSKSNSTQVENLAGKLSILESAALMKNATRNYVNDSGPLHMASAMNAPVTAFFCSTIPSFGFGPLSDDSKISEIKDKLYCRPCGLHGHNECPEKHFRCGREIEITEEKIP